MITPFWADDSDESSAWDFCWLGDDLLPAGVTRFLVPERALRLNIDLAVLASPDPIEVKQQALESLLAARARAGRIRRYEETIVVLDD